MEIRENVLTAEEFRKIFIAVGWTPPETEQVRIGLSNSLRTFSLYQNESLVGMARLLGDGVTAFFLKDFAVLPEWQGKGLGRALIEHIQRYIQGGLPKGWWASFELISAKGKEGFYQKLGFELRPSQNGGAGMFQMIGES